MANHKKNKIIAFLMATLFIFNVIPAGAFSLTYDNVGGNISYNSGDTTTNESSVFISIYDSVTGILDNVSKTLMSVGDSISGSLQNFVDKINSKRNVKIFHLDEASQKPTGDTLFEGTIEDITRNIVELDKITNTVIYTYNGNDFKETNTVDANALSDYIVKLDMADKSVLYATIKSVDSVTGDITLDLPNTVARSKDGKLNKDIIINSAPSVTGLDVLLNQIKSNPSGTFVLTSNIDASMFNTTSATQDNQGDSDAAFMGTFTGTLDGNGYKILNLKVPMFLKTENATIKNFTIEDANIVSGKGNNSGRYRNGAVAMTSVNTNIENVHIRNVYIKTTTYSNNMRIGGIVGHATSTNIRQSSIEGLDINTFWNTVGGLVGEMNGGSVTDSYVLGSIGNLDRNHATTKVGGLIGRANNVTINNNIANVVIHSNEQYTTNLVGGLVGSSEGTTIGANNLVMGGTVNSGHKFTTPAGQNKYTNSFEIDTSSGTPSSSSGISAISKDSMKLNNFYRDTLKLSASIWDLEYMNLTARPYFLNSGIVNGSSTPGMEIPNYGALIKNPMFDKDKEKLYYNLSKLMPFTMGEQILALADNTKVNHYLNQKVIKGVLPLSNGKYKAITNTNYNTFDKLLISFNDSSREILDISDPKITNYGAASYVIDSLGVYFVSDSYIVDTSSNVHSEISQMVANTQYERDLLPLVGGRDNDPKFYSYGGVHTNADYNMLDETADAVLKDGDNFATNFLSSKNYSYNNNVKHPLIEKIVINDVKGNIKQSLYSYLYYRTWYNIDFDYGYLPDIMLFNPSYYNDGLNLEKIADKTVNAPRDDRRSNNTSKFYKNNLSRITGFDKLSDFMDYNILTLSNETDPNIWFDNNFSGVIIEVPVSQMPDFNLKVYDKFKIPLYENMLLPSIAFDNYDLYILSVPSQIMIGSISTYLSNIQGQAVKDEFVKTSQGFTNDIKAYYGNSSGVVERAAEILLKYPKLVLDTFYEQGKWVVPVDSKSPAKKYFYSALKYSPGLDPVSRPGLAGFANGTTIYMVHGSTITQFPLFTHENAHNQDGQYFLSEYGRRAGEAEMYTEGVFSNPPYGNGSGVNFVGDADATSDQIMPLKAESINTNDKMQKKYEKLYQAMYLLNLIEVEAILSLPTEIQRTLLYRYTLNPNSFNERVVWKSVPTLKEFEALGMKDYKDLIRNRFNITREESDGDPLAAMEKYITPQLLGASLSTPHNDIGDFPLSWGEGIPDHFTYKRFAQEIISLDGYRAFVAWMSGQSANDLEALRRATKDPTMTFERFDEEKHTKVLDKYKQNGSEHIDWDRSVEWFKNAYIKEYETADRLNDYKDRKPYSGAVREALIRQLSRTTNDFEESIFEPKQYINVSTAQELVDALQNNSMENIKLTRDIDFAGYTYTGDTVIRGDFVGGLNGDGHSIKNLERPLFDRIHFSVIENLKFEGVNIRRGSNDIAVIARNSKKSSFVNIHIADGSIISGNSNVGGLTARDTNSLFDSVSVNADVFATGGFSGGLVATADGTSVTNSYTMGNLSLSNGTGGGLIGEVTRANIKACYSAMNIKLTGDNASAGSLIGHAKTLTQNTNVGVPFYTYNYIADSIALGGGLGVRKIDGTTPNANVMKTYVNCYEIDYSLGNSLTDELGINSYGIVQKESSASIMANNFYENILSFDTKIWETKDTANGINPKLTSKLDTNSSSLIIIKEVSNLQEFLAIANDNTSTFSLTADIDFSNYTSSADVIINDFSGRLIGNNHSLIGVKQPLFGNLTGIIENISIKDANIRQNLGEDIGVIAKTTNDALLYNIMLENIAVTGKTRVGGLIGTATDTRLSEISAKGVNITGETGGSKLGGLIGAMSGGNLTNAYVSGSMSVYGTDNGGVIGFVGYNNKKSTIASVFSKVNIAMQDTAGKNTAGFNGQHQSGSVIRNSISIGDMSGNPLPKKFTAGNEGAQFIPNSYQYEGSAGTNNTGAVKTATQKDITTSTFYTETLLFDDKIWDVSNVATGDPLLRFTTPKPVIPIKYNIETVEDLINISRDMDGDYTLENNLNLSQIKSNTIVLGEFSGTIDGKGNSLLGSTRPIFETIKNSTIKNLIIKDSNISMTKADDIGALAKQSLNSTIDNVHVKYANIEAKQNIGGLIGKDDGSNISRVSVNATVNSLSDNSGVVIGNAVNTNISNSYSMGNLTSSANFAGGLVGRLEASNIINTYSFVDVVSTSSDMAGTMIGGIIGASKVENSIAFGDGTNARALDGNTANSIIASSYINSYEYDASSADSLIAVLGNTTHDIKSLTETVATTKSFYSQLGFDSSNWILDFVTAKQLPTINSPLDDNAPSLGVSGSITTVQGLMNISNNLSGDYTLGGDIDLSSYSGASKTIISGSFKGTLDGNGYKIYNSTYTLFDDVNVGAKVSNIHLEDFSFNDPSMRELGVFANTINGAVVNKISFNNISMQFSFASYVGLLAQSVSNKSEISEINATNISIGGYITDLGGLIASIQNSSIRDVYIQGDINVMGAGPVGFVNVSTNSKIENIFVDVNIEDKSSGAAGFVFTPRDTALKNIVSVGNVIGGNKFLRSVGSGTTFSKVYILDTALGNTDKAQTLPVTQTQLEQDTFYKNTLGLNDTIWDLSNVSSAGRPKLAFVK